MSLKREGEIRIPSGCAISAIFCKDGELISGHDIIKSIAVMHERSNGLGGGFAAYGIYPEFSDLYAFHLYYDNDNAKSECENFLKKHFEIASFSKMPTLKTTGVIDEPLIWRYFVFPLSKKLSTSKLDEKEFAKRCVIKINTKIDGAYVFSSGKNMGIFKGVGYPEDIGRFFMLDSYKGYCFTAHGRYPTNTPGWWGGAHPFGLLDLSVVHNGEISSYDANRRSIEMYGYKCTLLTDTEVITYILDYLTSKVKLTLSEAANVIAAPFWQTIDNFENDKRAYYEYLRSEFSSQLITGPFSIIVGFEGGIMALNDRIKLRSMVVAERNNKVFIASEECAIRAIEPKLDKIYAPCGGEPVIVTLDNGGGFLK